MREDDDANPDFTRRSLRRFIILVAVIIAVPVVMWTITGLRAHLCGAAEAPTIQPMMAAPVATAPDQRPTIPADNRRLRRSSSRATADRRPRDPMPQQCRRRARQVATAAPVVSGHNRTGGRAADPASGGKPASAAVQPHPRGDDAAAGPGAPGNRIHCADDDRGRAAAAGPDRRPGAAAAASPENPGGWPSATPSAHAAPATAANRAAVRRSWAAAGAAAAQPPTAADTVARRATAVRSDRRPVPRPRHRPHVVARAPSRAACRLLRALPAVVARAGGEPRADHPGELRSGHRRMA